MLFFFLLNQLVVGVGISYSFVSATFLDFFLGGGGATFLAIGLVCEGKTEGTEVGGFELGAVVMAVSKVAVFKVAVFKVAVSKAAVFKVAAFKVAMSGFVKVSTVHIGRYVAWRLSVGLSTF